MTTTKTEKQLTDTYDLQDARAKRILNAYIKSQDSVDKYDSREISFEPLHGGFSGAPILRFNFNNRSFVLRLFKPEIEESDKIQQIQNAELAGELEVGPRVYFVDSEMEGYIMDYIPGRTVKNEDFITEKKLRTLALLLKRLHGSQLSSPLAKHPIQMFYRFIENGKKQSASYPSKIDEVVKIMQEIEIALKRYPLIPVPCHLDINSQNLMLHENTFLLIDWEVGGLSDPYFDLSMSSVFLRLNETQQKMFLQHYFERTPSAVEWSHYIVSQPICLFLRAAVFLFKSEEQRSSEDYERAINNSEVPSFSELMQLHEESRLHLPRWMIGLSMMQGGFDLVESNHFQESMKQLHIGVGD